MIKVKNLYESVVGCKAVGTLPLVVTPGGYGEGKFVSAVGSFGANASINVDFSILRGGRENIRGKLDIFGVTIPILGIDKDVHKKAYKMFSFDTFVGITIGFGVAAGIMAEQSHTWIFEDTPCR